MKSQLVTALLIAGLNIPVFLELYKHALKSKAAWIRTIITIVFWTAAIATQTIAAFAGILYLYFAYYRHWRVEQDEDAVDVWHIKLSDTVMVILMAVAARMAILLLNLAYIIILDKLVKYNIKLQDIISYYSEAKLILKLILAMEIIVIAPIVEEFVFRYFLYDKVLGPKMPLYIAAIFSAAFFTVMHFNVSGVPTFFGLGLFCTYLYQKKGYWAAVIAHAASNLITLLFI
jgi:membrane protease YdiL (CAAX protease family)